MSAYIVRYQGPHAVYFLGLAMAFSFFNTFFYFFKLIFFNYFDVLISKIIFKK
jgi:hypothetical protein